MNADDFRRIALGMKNAIEHAHMGHPDFRVNGRIFATLHADHQWGMVKLTPEQQQIFVRNGPLAFVPEAGAWGRQGCTAVRLDIVDDDTLGQAITLAWQNATATRVRARRAEKRKPERMRSSRERDRSAVVPFVRSSAIRVTVHETPRSVSARCRARARAG